MRLGAHIGITDGFDSAAHTAKKIGCESMQIFSKSPQMWKGAAISDESAARFRAAVEEDAVTPIAIHHGYLLNLASPKAFMLKRSRGAFVDELERAVKLGVDQLIFHPGAHLGSGPEEGLRTIVESLNWAFSETPDLQVRALLENCAGQGTGLCSSFEELQGILDRLDRPGARGGRARHLSSLRCWERLPDRRAVRRDGRSHPGLDRRGARSGVPPQRC